MDPPDWSVPCIDIDHCRKCVQTQNGREKGESRYDAVQWWLASLQIVMQMLSGDVRHDPRAPGTLPARLRASVRLLGYRKIRCTFRTGCIEHVSCMKEQVDLRPGHPALACRRHRTGPLDAGAQRATASA